MPKAYNKKVEGKCTKNKMTPGYGRIGLRSNGSCTPSDTHLFLTYGRNMNTSARMISAHG